MTADMVVRADRVCTPSGIRPAAVVVEAGRIVEVAEPSRAPASARAVDAGGAVVLPGLVDSHVHVNEPGRADWEGFETATRAAAAGGVTTIVDMPLNALPPTVDVAALNAKRAAASASPHVDIAFWGGAVPGSAAALGPLWRAGVRGFKSFLADSGVEEFAPLEAAELGRVMRQLAGLGALQLVHAESASVLARAQRAAAGDPRRYATYLDSRPDAAEVEAVRLLVALVGQTGCRAHVLHLSSADALEPLAQARTRGLPLTAETCPHYLTFAAEDVPDGATAFKCAPPIRSRANRERLWEGLADGLIDAVVSDHSPCPPARKLPEEGDFLRAWGGISSLQLGLPAMWAAASARGLGLADVARWMCEAPARVAGLARKGVIAPGYDADLVVFDPDAEWTVDPCVLEHRHPVTPYAGRRLRGVVRATYLAGAEAFRDGVFAPPSGRLIPA